MRNKHIKELLTNNIQEKKKNLRVKKHTWNRCESKYDFVSVRDQKRKQIFH